VVSLELIVGCQRQIWIVSLVGLRRFIVITVEMVRMPIAHELMSDVTTTITDLVLLAISSKANLLDSFVSLYAIFVGALHRIIGVEFGMFPQICSSHLLTNRGTLTPHSGDEVQEPKFQPSTGSYDIRNSRCFQGIVEPVDAGR